MYLTLLMRATWEQPWRLRYSAAPPTHVTLFARHFNRWLIALHQKIAQCRGLLIPPEWVCDGWDDCSRKTAADQTWLVMSRSATRRWT